MAENLAHHGKGQKQEMNPQCRFCHRAFNDRSNRKRHEQNKHPVEYQQAAEHKEEAKQETCDICNKKYASAESLAKHKKLKHKEDQNQHPSPPLLKEVLNSEPSKRMRLDINNDSCVQQQQNNLMITEEDEIVAASKDQSVIAPLKEQYTLDDLYNASNQIPQQSLIKKIDTTGLDSLNFNKKRITVLQHRYQTSAEELALQVEESKLLDPYGIQDSCLQSLHQLPSLQASNIEMLLSNSFLENQLAITAPIQIEIKGNSQMMEQPIQQNVQSPPAKCAISQQQERLNLLMSQINQASQSYTMTSQGNMSTYNQYNYDHCKPLDSPEKQLIASIQSSSKEVLMQLQRIKQLMDQNKKSEDTNTIKQEIPENRDMKAVLEYVLKTLTEKGELICSETPVLTKKDPKQKDGIMTRGRSCTINDTQVKKTKISIAYGEITSFKMGELYSIFSQFTDFDKNSVFIDVGSGHGKAVYQMAALANCTSYGIEAFLSRYKLSIEMMDLKNYPPTLHQQAIKLLSRVQLSYLNLSNFTKFTSQCGRDVTHLYSFNAQFSDSDDVLLYERIKHSPMLEIIALCDRQDKLVKHNLLDFKQVDQTTLKLSGSKEKRELYIYLRDFTQRHLIIAFEMVMPDFIPSQEELQFLSSFFNRYSYVDRAIEEIKKYISIEAASKHFMVVFTLVELYNQKHQYLKEARNFMWHYERYHDLLTLLNNIFKDIFKQPGIYHSKKYIFNINPKDTSLLNGIRSKKSDSINPVGMLEQLLTHLSKLIPQLTSTMEENEITFLFDYQSNLQLDHFRAVVGNEYFTTCKFQAHEIQGGSEIYSKLKKHHSNCIKKLNKIETYARSLPLKPDELFDNYSIPEICNDDYIMSSNALYLQTFYQPSQKRMMCKVLAFEDRSTKILSIFQQIANGQSSCNMLIPADQQQQVKTFQNRSIQAFYPSQTKLQEPFIFQAIDHDITDFQSGVIQGLDAQDYKYDSITQNSAILPKEMILSFIHDRLRDCCLSECQVLLTTEQSIILQGYHQGKRRNNDPPYIIKYVPKFNECFDKDNEIDSIMLLQKKKSPGKAFIIDIKFEYRREDYYVLVMKKYPYTFYDFLKYELDQTQKRLIAWALIEAVRLMHSQSIYHRDLKPGNILFNEKLVPKIVDFGLANSIDRKAGTRAFYAPEQQCEYLDIDPVKIDYWGLGIIIYALVKGKDPVFIDHNKEIQPDDLNGCGVYIQMNENEDETLLNFVQLLLQRNPAKRDLDQAVNTLQWYPQQVKKLRYQDYDFIDKKKSDYIRLLSKQT